MNDMSTELLIATALANGGGGGGGGTTNYNALSNKPKVNGVTLEGDKTPADLGIDTEKLDGLAARVAANETAIADRYTKTETDELIADELSKFDHLDYKIVTELPAAGDAGVRYLIKHATDTRYEEYIYVDNQWYDIGATDEVNLDNYYTKTETDGLLANKQDTLVSGTNIKKIGNVDLLGSGAIDVATVNNKSLLDGGNVSTAKIIYDAEYQTTQISDAESNAQIGINKVDGNTLNINEYAPDSRGQSQEVFNMNIPTKGYVDTEVDKRQRQLTYNNDFTFTAADAKSGSTTVDAILPDVAYFNGKLGMNLEVGVEKWYGTYTDESGVTYQVYTKVVYIPALPATAGITTYPHGITGIKQILSVYGFTTDGFVLNAPRQTISDNISIYQVQKSATGGIAIEVGKDRSSKKAYLVLIYAKDN